MQKQCHKCQFNGLGSDECLKCVGAKDLRLPNTFVHLSPDFQVKAKKAERVKNVTALSEDVEDSMRQFLCDFFDLPIPMLLMFVHIMHRGTLTSFDSFVVKVHDATKRHVSRQRAYKIKEDLIAKMESTLAAPLVARAKSF